MRSNFREAFAEDGVHHAVRLDRDVHALCSFTAYAIPQLRSLGWRVDLCDVDPAAPLVADTNRVAEILTPEQFAAANLQDVSLVLWHAPLPALASDARSSSIGRPSRRPDLALLVLVAFAPNVWTAMTLFVLRGLLSQMDVPVRTSYVMAVVSPAERAAAASITNVPRSLASALPPMLAGWMLDRSNFGWPLLMCATLKITYDLLLLRMFKDVRPPEER